MRTNIFLLSLIIIFIVICIPVNAQNETHVIEQVSMYIYGNAQYLNREPLPAGTIIIAKDQFNSELGKYLIRNTGKIGKDYGGTSENFKISVWRNQSDKINRTLPIFVTFYINNNSIGNQITFQQNENMRFDISTPYMPSSMPTPTSTPTPTLPYTTFITIPVTDSITTQNLTIVTPTITPTEMPSTISVPTTSVTIIKVVEPSLLDGLTTIDYIYYGIIGCIIVLLAIIIIGIVVSYATDKTSRDDVLSPDEKSKEK